MKNNVVSFPPSSVLLRRRAEISRLSSSTDGAPERRPSMKAGVYFSSRRELARERARKILSHEYQISTSAPNGMYELDTYRCGWCDGHFPELGRCRFFYDGDLLVYVHDGCYSEVEGWAADPDDEGGAA